MKCPLESREETELLAYSQQKLDVSRAATLERHLESCSACRQFVAGQQAVWQLLDAWEAPAIASDFDRQLYGRIEQERNVTWWNRWLGPLLVRPGLPVAAAACLVVAVGLIVRRPAEKPGQQPQSAQVQNLQPDQVEHALDDMEMLSEFTRAARPDAGEL